MLNKQISDLRSELSRVRAPQPAVHTSAMDYSGRAEDFLAQMDELESSYQNQIAELEAQMNSVKAENLTLCMELQDVGKEAQRVSQEVWLLCAA
jgi:predicted  nucleic acid-binding Zn-ribbon protein